MCNKAQLKDYLDYFLDRDCKFEIIIWNKTNVPPFTCGHYIADKEYCLVFWEKGAKIKMMIAPLGTLSCDTINTFDSVGINHTLHRVGYEFNVSFKAAAPFHTSSFQVKFTILICETIIVGKVPSVYVN